MQPYFLPYIGYFQLMKAVDVFVLYDDVTWIKQGWINRNRILLDNTEYMFTLEVRGASSNNSINLVEVGNNRPKLLKTFIQAYKKAPNFQEHEQLLFLLFQSIEKNLVQYILMSFANINRKLGIETKLFLSSDIEKDNSLKGQEKVINICKNLNADTYINTIGGSNLYSKTDFAVQGIKLLFLKSHEINYSQYGGRFIPWLSIIDVLMFNNNEKIRSLLEMYELI
jgi:hypothetical protein